MGCIRAVEERWRIRLTGDSAGTENGWQERWPHVK